MNIQFGSGVLFGVPNAGNTAANPTPYRLGVLQEVSVDFKGDSKKLFGQSQFPVAVARGKIEVGCKAKLAVLDPGMLNQLYFGQASATGITQIADGEAQPVPAIAPYTVPVANAATFVTDYGVQYAANGQQLVKVAAAPALGQYSVSNAGVYTFAAADEGVGMLISYSYTTAARGATITLVNELMGYAPRFQALLYNNFGGKFFAIQLNACMASHISVPTKQEDYWVVDFEFDAFTDASNTLGKIFADVS